MSSLPHALLPAPSSQYFFCLLHQSHTPTLLFGTLPPMQRDLSTAGFNPNKQTQCTPLLATSIKQKLEGGASTAPAAAAPAAAAAGEAGAPAADGGAAPAPAAAAAGSAEGAAARHHPLLLRLLAKELGCAADDIVDFELNVIDTQPGVIGGEWVGGWWASKQQAARRLRPAGPTQPSCSLQGITAPLWSLACSHAGGEDEFIFSGRLDNLCMSWCVFISCAFLACLLCMPWWALRCRLLARRHVPACAS